MEAAITALLAEYERRAADEWRMMEKLPAEQIGARIDEFLLFVGPDTGRLLHMLATSSRAQCIVEIGASYGYSTIWFAHAAKQTGGKVHSFELSEKKIAYASDKLRSVGLDKYVQFHVGSALETLPRLAGPVDLVLIDLWKQLYKPCFDLVYPKLSAEAIIVADNMLYPKETRAEAVDYQKHIRARADLDSVLLPIGSGIEISRKRGPERS